jgi:hypothetical protein
LKEVIEDFITNFDYRGNEPEINLRKWSRASDRAVLEIPSLGAVTVKIKKLGQAWDPAPCKQGDWQYSIVKLFCLRNGKLAEESVTEAKGWPVAAVRYLVEVKLE